MSSGDADQAISVGCIGADDLQTHGGDCVCEAATTFAAKVFQAYNRKLINVIRRRVGAEDAEDLAQEAYLKLLKCVESGSIDPFSVDNPESYIVQIGRSVTFDHLRRGQARASGKHFPISEIGEAETLRSDVARQDDELASKQGLTQAMRAINAMPPLMKEVFIRHRFREMTYKEIAVELDISTAAVGRQIASALALLHSEVNGAPEDPKRQ